MALTFLDRHRGPFRFNVGRPDPKKKGFHTSEWLKGTVDRADVADEAQALLTDPRDTIESVHVWSEGEQQFVGGYSRETQLD